MKIRTFPSVIVTGLAVLTLGACSSSSSTDSTGSTGSSVSSASTDGASGSSADISTIPASGDTTASGSGGTSPSTTAPAPSILQVFSGPGIKFDLPEYTTNAGPVHVIFENRDSQRHTLAFVGADGKNLPGELEVVKSGSKAEGDFTLQAGTYKLICTVPGHNAMKATLTVG